MTENRIESTTVANAETNARTASISPTGTPMLPARLAPWLTLLVAVAALLPLVPGLPPVVLTVCGLVVALGAALGIASPGARRQP
jgi:hypothetical protein